MTESSLERIFASHCRLTGLPAPDREVRFDPARRWRFDFAWPDRKLAVEVEGGTWVKGRHSRGSGMAKDAEKYNAAALAGWVVLRFTSNQVRSGDAVRTLAQVFNAD